jgi:FkbM family methyltransferase
MTLKNYLNINMKNKITAQNTILKTDENLYKKGIKSLHERGFLFFFKKTFSVVFLLLKRIFREYIPLKLMFLLSKDGKIIKTIQGSKMILDLNDIGISRELACYGVHEKNSTAEVKKIITPGMQILEVGANIGYYALLETRLAGPTGHLYAMEPSPYNFDLLTNNLNLNGLKNYDLYKLAAGATAGKAPFLLSGRSNLSTFVEREDLTGEEVEVDVIKLDDKFGDKKVDFIRMDVEGYEGEILRGSEGILSSDKKPKYFFIEVHSDLLHKKNSSARHIVEFLGKYGYEIHKSFWRGGSEFVAYSKSEMLDHPLLEVGYWETFFELK